MEFLSEDVLLESVRAAIVFLIVIYLYRVDARKFGARRKGWSWIVWGFFLLLFASIMDITDEIDGLEKYIVIGDTPTQAFLEKVVGFLGGFTFIAVGLLRWMPLVQSLTEEIDKQTIDLREAMAKSEDASSLKSQFLANMSHEIRTPMNGVIGSTGLILASEVSADVRRYAQTTLNSAESLLSLINDILDFSKIEAGRMDLEEVDFDLQTLLQDTLEVFIAKCYEKDIELLFHLDSKTPTNIVGDAGRIRQIVTNLLGNSIKFTKSGHIYLNVYASTKAGGENILHIDVEDTGVGVPDDKQVSIFGKFDQGDATVTRQFGGTGLGLPICKSLAELMGGQIDLRSEVNVGSVFSLSVPLVESETLVFKESAFDRKRLLSRKILVLDDNELAGGLITQQLAEYGCRTVNVLNEKDAIKVLKMAADGSEPFDAVIVDHEEQSLANETLSKRIRAQKSLSNTIMILALSTPLANGPALIKKTGYSGYLRKPIFPGEVPHMLSLILEKIEKGDKAPFVTPFELQDDAYEVDEDLVQHDKAYVLLVEDNPVNLMIASTVLHKCGCTVAPAGDGIEAIEMFNQQKFDLIFMDCHMPVMGGLEATMKIRKIEELRHLTRTPIIAFTANAMEGDRQECLAAGMDDYVSKPVGRKTLENMLSKWIDVKSQAGTLSSEATSRLSSV